MSALDDKTNQLIPALTPEFLSTLIELSRVVGWRVDFSEIDSFIEEAHEIAGVDCPAVEERQPYYDED